MNPRTSLSGLDTAFLSLETETTPMNMVGTLVLDAPMAVGGSSFEQVIRLVEERAARLVPFRRRMVAMPFGLDHPVWVEDRAMDVRHHVQRVRAPAPGSERILAELVAEIAARPLDRTRPLWQLTVVEGLAGGRIAFVFKLHHAMADGLSAAMLMLRLLDSPIGDADEAVAPPRIEAGPACTRAALLAHAVSRLPERSIRLARLLRHSIPSLGGIARSIASGGSAGVPRMPIPFSAPRTPWNRSLSAGRTVAFGTERLSDLKEVASAFGATINLVVLAACTQTLRSYLKAHGGVPDGPLVAAIPVSLRSRKELWTCGNRLSALLVHLPVHLDDPTDQLLTLKHDAAASKRQHARLGLGSWGEWAEFAPNGLLSMAARFYSGRKLADRHRPLHNLVISNVRGPASRLYAAGAPLCAAYPCGPLMDGVGLNITVLSHGDSVDFGVVACRAAVPHAADIALGFGAAVGQLRKLAVDMTSQRASSIREAAMPDPDRASARRL